MGYRTVREIVAKDGAGELKSWCGKYMDMKEKARFEQRLMRIQTDQTVNGSWFKRYKAISGWEIVFDIGGKAYRFLSDQAGSEITVLVAVVKKGHISSADEGRAIAKMAELRKGTLSVRNYFES